MRKLKLFRYHQDNYRNATWGNYLEISASVEKTILIKHVRGVLWLKLRPTGIETWLRIEREI